jgi:hypothetical protein|tara:strand:- start:2988 stop:3152 length:165 start_codon:yes stop_codon:yes gene_type:complete
MDEVIVSGLNYEDIYLIKEVLEENTTFGLDDYHKVEDIGNVLSKLNKILQLFDA